MFEVHVEMAATEEHGLSKELLFEESGKDLVRQIELSEEDPAEHDEDVSEETAKIRKLVEAQLEGDSDDSDEMSEEEGDKPKPADAQ